MRFLCMTDFAIEFAQRSGTLRVTKHWSERLQMDYWAICKGDELITTANSEEEAQQIIERACGK